MHALLRLALAACLLLPLATRAADADARADSIRTMLVELELVEAYLASSRKIIDDAGPDLAWLDRELTSAQALDRMVPIYARYLSPGEAEELTAFFSKPPGEKAWNFLLERMRGSDGLPSTPLAWHEKQAVDAYLKTSSGWNAYRAAQERIAADLNAMTSAWSGELMRRHYGPQIERLARQTALGATADDPLPAAATGAAADAGGDFIAAHLALVTDFAAQSAAVHRQLAARQQEIGIGDVLSPAALSTRAGIDRGRGKLEDYARAYSAAQRRLNQISDAFAARLKNLAQGSAFRQSWIRSSEESLARAYDRSLRTEENQRRILALMGQFLDLADQSLGSIRLEDNRLVFARSDDLRRYEALHRQLQAEARIEAGLQEEQRQSQQRLVDALPVRP